MNSQEDLILFANTLAGVYDNYDQSQGNPKDFARINIFFRPLPWTIFHGPGFYSEQCYDYSPWEPYRQGLHQLKKKDGLFIMENYGFNNSSRLAGAGKNPQLLKAIDVHRIQPRCGCAMHFKTKRAGHYIGSVEPGKNCLVPRDGKLTYLVSEVEVNEEIWISRDRGFDPETDEQLWGSEHGQLRFKRVSHLSDLINSEWIQQLN
ncbi:chromophore lyase CpcT/CpeT [Synechococcus sp. MIT S1220]|uniref:chromophore lyase CpcT/CpeT n=1 Tax=Synechococcus sp. MIT S1220 TaxID=3082549 RepID=UPI0039AED059